MNFDFAIKVRRRSAWDGYHVVVCQKVNLVFIREDSIFEVSYQLKLTFLGHLFSWNVSEAPEQ